MMGSEFFNYAGNWIKDINHIKGIRGVFGSQACKKSPLNGGWVPTCVPNKFFPEPHSQSQFTVCEGVRGAEVKETMPHSVLGQVFFPC